MIGLYAIVFENGKRYIGISKNPRKRFREHELNVKWGSTLAVHCAMRVMSYEHQVLCYGSEQYIRDLEIRAIASFQTRDRVFGYNIQIGGDLGVLGLKMSDETKAKMSRSGKGRPKTREHAMKIGASRRGKFWTPEMRARGSEAQKRRVRTPEEIARMSEIVKKRVVTEEYRANMCAAQQLRRQLERA